MSHRVIPLVLVSPDGLTRYRCLECNRPASKSGGSRYWRHYQRAEWRPGARPPRNRYCRRCDETWPLTREFFRVARRSKAGKPIWQCLACQREHCRRYYERRRVA